MTEKPKSIWTRKLPARTKWLAVLLIAILFATFLVTMNFGTKAGLIWLPALGGMLLLLLVLFIRWLCCWRNFRRFLLGIVCLVTLLALVITEENWRGKRAWENFKREWEAKGERFDMFDFTPPLVPDDQNFAMTPFLKIAFEYTHVKNEVVWRDTNSPLRLGDIKADKLTERPRKEISLGSIEKGTFANLQVCREFYRGNTNYPQPVKPTTAAKDILVALGKFDREIQQLRDAMVTRPYSRFPIEYDFQPPNDILLPHLGPVKGLTRLVQMRVVAQIENHQNQPAFDELKLGFHFADSIRDEPFLISHLVRIAILAMDIQTLREGLVRHAWSDAQLAELEKHLATTDLFAEYNHTMRGERALNLGSLDYLRRHGYEASPAPFMDGDGSAQEMNRNLIFLISGVFYQNMLTISRMHQKFTLAAVDEKQHRVFPEISNAGANAVEALHTEFFPYVVFARMLLPAYGRTGSKTSRTQTFVDTARVACALERYRLAEGKLPESLDPLTPRFIAVIPNDVIDGQPLRYRLEPDGGYVLYSIGWNQTDDGGKIGWTKPSKKGERNVNITAGDWVWQMPTNPATAPETTTDH